MNGMKKTFLTPCKHVSLREQGYCPMSTKLKAPTGEAQRFVIPSCGVIDAHMHIMSGNCSPLPVAWAQMPEAILPGLKLAPRSLINASADSLPAKLADSAIVRDQVQKISAIATKLGGLAGKAGAALNAAENGCAIMLVGVAQNILQTQRKLVAQESRTGLDTVCGILQFVKDELSAGADLASEIDAVVQRVCAKMETARAQVSKAAQSAGPVVDDYRLSTPQQKLALSTIQLAASVAEGIIGAVSSASAGAAKLAQTVTGIAGSCASGLKKLAQSIGEGAASVAQSFFDHGVQAAFHAGAEAFLVLVKKETQANSAVAGAAAAVCETAANIVQGTENDIVNLTHLLSVQKNGTDVIGARACAAIPGKAAPFNPLVGLLMDMEYAHLDGYQGLPVYRKATKRYYVQSSFVNSEGIEVQNNASLPPDYEPGHDALQNVQSEPFDSFRYYRYDRDASGTKGPALWMYLEETKLFENYPTQMTRSVGVAMKNPWKLFPLYHYDPRRWINSWKFPFSRLLQTASADPEPRHSPRAFLGFKMYPSLGYHPLDEHLPHLNNFYAECAKQKIPILAHCSPGGYRTHEWENYLGYYRSAKPSRTPENKSYGIYQSTIGGVSPQAQFFMENIAAPQCWKKVLDLPGCGGLKLCLAHFAGGGDASVDILYAGWNKDAAIKNSGAKQSDALVYSWRDTLVDMITCGKYPNLYTDISCFQIAEHYDKVLSTIQSVFDKSAEKGAHLLSRIMFGTDWYVTEIDGKNYRAFYDANLEQVNKLDDALRKKGYLKHGSPTLWQRFGMINPFEFYDFFALRDNIKKVMLSWGLKETDGKLIDGYKMVGRMKKKINVLKKNA